MMAKIDGKRPKHIPLRTCISCKDEKSKRELLRVVRTPEGRVAVDISGKGKLSGRGAYLCARLSCWQRAMEKNLLEREFKISIVEEDRAGLHAFMAQLPKEEPAPAQPARARRPSASGLAPDT